MTRRLLALLATWLLIAAAAPISADPLAPNAPLNERVLDIAGDPSRPVSLQVTLFSPSGPGPFPLAIMNHGATEISASNRGERYRHTFSAYYFLSRGYAVALPMMRGFAGSGGNLTHHGCDLVANGLDNAKDILAVLNYLATQPGIDATRVVVAGQSFGGWNTLAFGTLDQTRVKGLVNFSGGVRASDCANQDASLIAASAAFGAHAKVPSIWFYGENDKIFPTATWRGMYQRYSSAGGRATLVDYGAFMDDAHQLLSHPEGLALWTPKVDEFLRSVGLPSTLVDGRYMPSPLPAPTHFAAVDNLEAIPYVNDRGRELYRNFLARRFPRAFAIATNGNASVANGGFDPLAQAMSNCEAHAADCQLYAVNDFVVWKGPPAKPEAPAEVPVYRTSVAAGTTSILNFAYSVNPDCTWRGLPRLSLTQQPSHGSAKVEGRDDYPKFPPNNPFSKCNQTKVPGVSVEYTPAAGFTGPDAITIEEITVDNRERVFRIAITVK